MFTVYGSGGLTSKDVQKRRFKFRLVGSREDIGAEDFGVLSAVGKAFEGRLRFHAPVDIGNAEGSEAIPSSPEKWEECYVVLDALSFTIFSSDALDEVLFRFDTYGTGRKVQNLTGGVFAFPMPYCFKNEWIFFETGSPSLASLWVEAIYQTASIRLSQSFTRCSIVERLLCGCLFGQDMYDLMIFQFAVFSVASVVFDFVSDLIDANQAVAPSLATVVSLVNDVLCLFALCVYSCIVSRKEPVQKVLSKSKKLCSFLALVYALEVCLGIGSVGDDDEVSRTFRERLASFVDVMNLYMWLNGVYLSFLADKILAQDITKLFDSVTASSIAEL